MYIAHAQDSHGHRMLVIGLDEENMARLANDDPILKELGDIVPAMEGWKLAILGSEDTARFIAQTGEINYADIPHAGTN